MLNPIGEVNNNKTKHVDFPLVSVVKIGIYEGLLTTEANCFELCNYFAKDQYFPVIHISSTQSLRFNTRATTVYGLILRAHAHG